MKLQTKRLVLRDLNKSDAKDIQSHINNIEIAKYLLVVPHPYSMKDARDFIQRQEKHAREIPRTSYNFGITLKEDGRVIGGIGIDNIDRFHGTASIGYWLSQTYWKNRYMTEALERVIAFGFRTLRLKRIDISAFAENDASNALIKKVGFIYEGQRKKHVRDKATKTIHDHNLYGMLREDWLKRSR